METVSIGDICSSFRLCSQCLCVCLGMEPGPNQLPGQVADSPQRWVNSQFFSYTSQTEVTGEGLRERCRCGKAEGILLKRKRLASRGNQKSISSVMEWCNLLSVQDPRLWSVIYKAFDLCPPENSCSAWSTSEKPTPRKIKMYKMI